MKSQLQSLLMILFGLALLASGVLGLFNIPQVEANPPDPQFETVAEYSAEEVQAGFAPIARPLGTEDAPTLEAFPTRIPGTPTPPVTASEPEYIPPQNVQAPPPKDLLPDRIVIEAISLDAPVKMAGMRVIKGYEVDYVQWLAPDEFAAGWHGDSATLGQVGNTVLNGHHNVFGEVFKDLKDLKSGELVTVYSGKWEFTYAVANVMILPERDQKLRLRLDNAQWIERSEDERLTLVTCWPPESNTHRVIVVAVPVSYRELP